MYLAYYNYKIIYNIIIIQSPMDISISASDYILTLWTKLVFDKPRVIFVDNECIKRNL